MIFNQKEPFVQIPIILFWIKTKSTNKKVKYSFFYTNVKKSYIFYEARNKVYSIKIIFIYKKIETLAFIVSNKINYIYFINSPIKIGINYININYIIFNKSHKNIHNVDLFIFNFIKQIGLKTYIINTTNAINFFVNYSFIWNNISTNFFVKVTKQTRYTYQYNLSQLYKTTVFNSSINGSVFIFNTFFSKNTIKSIKKKIKIKRLFTSKKYISRLKRSNIELIKYEQTSFRHFYKVNKHSQYFIYFPFFFKKQGKLTAYKRRKKKIKSKAVTKLKVLYHKIKKKNAYFYNKRKINKAIYYKVDSTINGSPFKQFKFIFSLMINSQLSFYMINALSLTKSSFNVNVDKITKKYGNKFKLNKANAFIKSLTREIIGRFRYIGIYIKDLTRITFICIYLKKATFLAFFYAFSLQNLPRKRKETQFIRFLIKMLKVVCSQRKEIIGIRIRIKGRLNRWRRTKFINGIKGHISYVSVDNRIEYGIAQAITRKGTQGISIWLFYIPQFHSALKQSIFNYFKLSKKINFI